MKRAMVILIAVLLAGIVSLNAQSITFKVGGFYPYQDSDLWDDNKENLTYDKGDMLGTYFGVEGEFFFGRYASLSLEAGRYRQDIFSEYKWYSYDDGTPIYQDFFLRMTFLEAGIKLYPLTWRDQFSFFIGGGVGLYAWKYYQGGEFVDYYDDTIFEGEAYSNRLAVGFNAKAGFIYRFSRYAGITFETRYTYVKDELGDLFEGFETFDLSGMTMTVGISFFMR